MQKRTFILLLLLTTMGAIAAAWFWALPPLLTPLVYLHPTDWTQADLVRHIWHFRLVQPEWVSLPPDYMRWSRAETLARLVVVFLAWLATTSFLVRRYGRGHRNTSPNQPAAGNAGVASRLTVEHHWPGVGEPGRSNMTKAGMALFVCLCLLSGGGCQKNSTSSEQPRTASGILVHYPSEVRTVEAWKGHNFLVDGVPVKPSEKVPELELLKCVGKRVTVTGSWDPGVPWKPTEEEKVTQMPVGLGWDEPVIRGDGIVVETVQELKDK